MFYFEYPTVDTTLYQATPSSSTNTGIDEIIEVRKDINDSGTKIDVSRILIKFSYDYISQSIQDSIIPSTAKYYLNLYDAASSELAVEQTLYTYIVSQSWTGGTGFYSKDPAGEDGASWKYSDNSTIKTQWVSGSDTQGGTWFTGSIGGTAAEYNVSGSENLTYETQDIRMDISDLVKSHIYSSSAYPNNGFIVKRQNLPTSESAHTIFNPLLSSGSAEYDTTHYGQLKFFSRETNTIYSPKLEVEWDDSSFSTGSLAPVSASELENLTVYFKNLRPDYREKSKIRIRFVGRELYPTRGFASTPAALTVKWLPSGSGAMGHGTYYSVKDAHTNETIIPFSTGSLVSCDSSGNYFNVWFDGFQPERHYRFLVQVISGSGSDQQKMIYDDGYEFKVVRS